MAIASIVTAGAKQVQVRMSFSKICCTIHVFRILQ